VRLAHFSFLSIILKRNGAPYSLVEFPPWLLYANLSSRRTLVRPVQYLYLCSLVLRSLCSHPNAHGGVQCKRDLNASRAPFVLEHNIRKMAGPLESGSCGPSVASPTLIVGLSARKT